jgi:phage I-like protein
MLGNVHMVNIVGGGADFMAVPAEPNGQPIEIIRTGTFNHPTVGQFDVTEEMIDQMIANFDTHFGAGRLPIDYNHGSLNEAPEESKAAGWIEGLFKGEYDDPERTSLMATVSWTANAIDLIGGDEFRYISAEMAFNYTHPEVDEPIGTTLLAAALTNRPFIPDMNPVALSQAVRDHLKADGSYLKANIPDSLMERLSAIGAAFYQAFPDGPMQEHWIRDITETDIILEVTTADGRSHFSLAYAYDEDASGYTFMDRAEWAEVKQAWVAASQEVAATGYVAVHPAVAANSDNTLTAGLEPATDEDHTMDELRKLLGLAEDADEGAIVAAVTALKDDAGKVEAMASENETLRAAQVAVDGVADEKGAEVVRLNAANEAWAAQNVELSGRVEGLEKERQDRNAGDLIANAVKSGKVAPVELEAKEGVLPKLAQLAYDDPDTFTALIDGRPARFADLMKPISKDEPETTIDPMDAEYDAIDAILDKNPGMHQSEARRLIQTNQ